MKPLNTVIGTNFYRLGLGSLAEIDWNSPQSSKSWKTHAPAYLPQGLAGVDGRGSCPTWASTGAALKAPKLTYPNSSARRHPSFVLLRTKKMRVLMTRIFCNLPLCNLPQRR